MKNKSLITLFAVTALLATVGGCNKEADPAKKPVEQTQAAGGSALEAAKDVAAAAQNAAKQVTDKADAILKQAESLIGAGKFEDALAALNNLSGMKLTESQQNLVADLKAEIQKALAGKTADSAKSAVGNLLGK